MQALATAALSLQLPRLAQEIAPNSEFLEALDDKILLSRNFWLGLQSGLYQTKKKGMVPKAGDDCFGTWIVSDINLIRDFRHHVREDFFDTKLQEFEDAWYAAGNLMFKNMDECHFLEVYRDLNSFCHAEVAEEKDDEWAKYDFDTELDEPDRCTFASLTQNMKANVFNLVTKVSAIGASFQDEGF